MPVVQNLAARHHESLCRGKGSLNSVLVSKRSQLTGIVQLETRHSWTSGKDHLNLFFKHMAFQMAYCAWQAENSISASLHLPVCLQCPRMGLKQMPGCSQCAATTWLRFDAAGIILMDGLDGVQCTARCSQLPSCRMVQNT